MATTGECTSDSYVKRIIEAHKLALPELVESEDENDSASESDQEYRTERASHRTYDADDTSEKEKLDIFQPPGKIWYEDLWQRSVTKEVAVNSCIVRKEIMNTDSQNAREKIEFKTGRKP